jgi:hypothetical protein
MSTIGYAAEKLWEAMHALALGAGRINARLEEAAVHVAQAAGTQHDMPHDLRTKYDAIWARLTAIPAAQGDEGAKGAVHATLAQMSEQDACDIASQIVDIAYMAKEAFREATKAEPAVREHASPSDLKDMFVSVAQRMAKLGIALKPAVARSWEKIVHLSKWLLGRPSNRH